MLVGGLLVWVVGWARRSYTRAWWAYVPTRHAALPCCVTTLIIAALIGAVANLATAYHVLGTDKVGQDVLYLSLKSIRTGLVIGTVTTLVMLPFALLLGVAAGYFRGWVDDVIQYIYTVLSSIPSVLLIAAAVLMMQVVIEMHAGWFETAAARADVRLLCLCLILGVTSWTGLVPLVARRDAEAARDGIHPGSAGIRRVVIPHSHAPHRAQCDAHRADLGGDGFQRAGAGRGGAVLCRRGRGSDHDQLRHHDQRGAAGDGARSDGVVGAGLRLRLHAGAGAGGEPVCRCGARCLRSAGLNRTESAIVTDLLKVEGLITRLRNGARIVDDISFSIRQGETFALLGESGCGKSMTALSLMRLLPDSVHVESGAVRLEDADILALPERDMREVRGGRMAMIFQEPGLSLNPVMTVGEQIAEALELHQGLRGADGAGALYRVAGSSGHSRCGAAFDMNIRSSFPAA